MVPLEDQPVVRGHARQAPPNHHRRPIFTRTAPRPLPTENHRDPTSLGHHARINGQSRAIGKGVMLRTTYNNRFAAAPVAIACGRFRATDRGRGRLGGHLVERRRVVAAGGASATPSHRNQQRLACSDPSLGSAQRHRRCRLSATVGMAGLDASCLLLNSGSQAPLALARLR